LLIIGEKRRQAIVNIRTETKELVNKYVSDVSAFSSTYRWYILSRLGMFEKIGPLENSSKNAPDKIGLKLGPDYYKDREW
jgi:hypothetical protein